MQLRRKSVLVRKVPGIISHKSDFALHGVVVWNVGVRFLSWRVNVHLNGHRRQTIMWRWMKLLFCNYVFLTLAIPLCPIAVLPFWFWCFRSAFVNVNMLSALSGNREECYRLGKKYLDGCWILVKKNPQKAFKWFSKAAVKGDLASLYELAVMYRDGVGVRVNLRAAREYFIMAEETSRPVKSMLPKSIEDELLRGEFSRTIGAKIESQEYWGNHITELVNQAELGNMDAKAELAYELIRGDVVEQNIGAALDYINQGVAVKNGMAENLMGVCFMRGLGVDQSPIEALKWFKRACGHGCPNAYANISAYYYDCVGVKRNLKRSLKYARKALVHGFIDDEFASIFANCAIEMIDSKEVDKNGWLLSILKMPKVYAAMVAPSKLSRLKFDKGTAYYCRARIIQMKMVPYWDVEDIAVVGVDVSAIAWDNVKSMYVRGCQMYKKDNGALLRKAASRGFEPAKVQLEYLARKEENEREAQEIADNMMDVLGLNDNYEESENKSHPTVVTQTPKSGYSVRPWGFDGLSFKVLEEPSREHEWTVTAYSGDAPVSWTFSGRYLILTGQKFQHIYDSEQNFLCIRHSGIRSI